MNGLTQHFKAFFLSHRIKYLHTFYKGFTKMDMGTDKKFILRKFLLYIVGPLTSSIFHIRELSLALFFVSQDDVSMQKELVQSDHQHPKYHGLLKTINLSNFAVISSFNLIKLITFALRHQNPIFTMSVCLLRTLARCH